MESERGNINRLGVQQLRKKISDSFIGRRRKSTEHNTPGCRTTPSNVSDRQTEAIKVHGIHHEDTEREFRMLIKENGEYKERRYNATSVMELRGAGDAIEKFNSELLPKGKPQRQTWEVKPGDEVLLRLKAGFDAPVIIQKEIDGNISISVGVGGSFAWHKLVEARDRPITKNRGEFMRAKST